MKVTHAADVAAANPPAAISWDQIGAKAGADYTGDGLVVTPTESGARLHCVFQRLDGEATPAGLWLTSTTTNAATDRFRVTAMEVGRTGSRAGGDLLPIGWGEGQLPSEGRVCIEGQTVRFSRPGLTEEYSVSMDGMRQDFIVEQAPWCLTGGELEVKLAVAGATVEAASYGARLVLENSGRQIAYSRLRVTDATGKELPARMEVLPAREEDNELARDASLLPMRPACTKLAVVVNDAEAVYPLRIDPTFSDANWVSLGGTPGTGGSVGGVGVVAAVAAVAVLNGTLYAGGAFTTAGGNKVNYIAQWNGTNWSALGSGMNNWVYALAVSGGTLYAGGAFTTAGGNAAYRIAQWNGTNWSALGSGMGRGDEYTEVYALAVSGGTLYAGGNFTTAGGNAANYIAQWNGTNWSALGSGMGGGYGTSWVLALAVSGGTLYAGGYFTTAGDDTNANYIAQWNGSSWSSLGSGVSIYHAGPPFVDALAVSGGILYAGGGFMTAGGTAANCIAQWNGSCWSALGSGLSGSLFPGGPYVQALAVSGGTLYAGGNFTTAGDDSNAICIAQWSGSSWSSLGSGLNDAVEAVAVSGGTLYAGGHFTMAGSTTVNYIAQWNGTNWSSLGSGISGGSYTCVYALAVSGGTLYAGGNFTGAGGTAANNIAQWNGSSWSALGPGMNSAVAALAVSGGTLYAGGYFTTAGDDTNANDIARWNGSSWSALGSGMNGDVYALAVSDGTLYAGGGFTTAGDETNANDIAQWNGSSWSALGPGMNGSVWALAVSGGTLYAGGKFTTAGEDTNANSIAQWNGSSWSSLGSGLNYPVLALAVSGGTLYAGGEFTTAGGTAAANIAQWNGSSWSSLGSGMNGSVWALAVSGGALYAGGNFTAAGGTGSAYVAEGILPVQGPPVIGSFNPSTGQLNITNLIPGQCCVVQTSTDLRNWVCMQTNTVSTASQTIQLQIMPQGSVGFYRLIELP